MINSINSSSSYWYGQTKNDSLNSLLTVATTNNKNLTVSSTTETTSDSNDSSDLMNSNISVEELMEMLKSGSMPPPPQGEATEANTEESTSETITDDSLSAYDTDGDGSISKDEYESMISELGIKNALSADELYAQYDTNEDGELSTDEIEAAHSQTQPLMPPPPMGPPPKEDSEDDTSSIAAVSTDNASETTADEVFSAYDTNQDGSIDADEFAAMWESASKAYEASFQYIFDDTVDSTLSKSV